MQYLCEDCKDTKQILCEGVTPGRPFYSIAEKRIVTIYKEDGDFQLIQCHCVGD